MFLQYCYCVWFYRCPCKSFYCNTVLENSIRICIINPGWAITEDGFVSINNVTVGIGFICISTVTFNKYLPYIILYYLYNLLCGPLAFAWGVRCSVFWLKLTEGILASSYTHYILYYVWVNLYSIVVWRLILIGCTVNLYRDM